MLLGLSKIIDCPGGVVPFETTLDLSEMEFGDCRPLAEPIHAHGQVRNTAGVVTKLESDQLDDPWTFELVGDEADLDDILTTVVVLNMDSQLLCKPDCQGLCPRCGKDLNEGPCDCRPERDPRLQVLEKLLNK